MIPISVEAFHIAALKKNPPLFTEALFFIYKKTTYHNQPKLFFFILRRHQTATIPPLRSSIWVKPISKSKYAAFWLRLPVLQYTYSGLALSYGAT